MYHSIVSQLLKQAVRDAGVSTGLTMLSMIIYTGLVEAASKISSNSFFKGPGAISNIATSPSDGLSSMIPSK